MHIRCIPRLGAHTLEFATSIPIRLIATGYRNFIVLVPDDLVALFG